MTKLELDRDDNGKALPTLKNKDVLEIRLNELGAEKMLEVHKKDYLEYTKWLLFDPRSKHHLVVYRTPEEAEQAKVYWDKIEVLDQEYLRSK